MTCRRVFCCGLLIGVVLSGCGHPSGSPAETSSAEPKEHAEEGERREERASEGTRTHIESSVAEESGIRVAKVGPGSIRDEHIVQGLLTPIEGKHARIVARFPGPIRRVDVAVGDQVKAGQTLAIVESNVSLSDYTVTSPFGGTVLTRNVTVGDLAGETPLFEIADLSKLWVDLHLFGGDAEHLRAGLPAEVTRLSDGSRASTRIERVLPGTATASQSTVARAVISNADERWRPGAAVQARVTVAEEAVSLIAPVSALQSLAGQEVVFVREGEMYEARPVKIGRRDVNRVELLDGVKTGEEIVVEQSYLIKANIEKSSVADED